MENPDLRHTASAPVPVLAPRGDLDLDSLGPLTAQIETVVGVHGTVILDAGGVTFADSSFLRLLLTTHDRADLRIANPSPTVDRLLRIVGADTFLHLYPTLDAARNA